MRMANEGASGAWARNWGDITAESISDTVVDEPADLDVARQDVVRLHSDVLALCSEGRTDQAILLAEQALSVMELMLGPEHPDIGALLHLLATLYYETQSYR